MVQSYSGFVKRLEYLASIQSDHKLITVDRESLSYGELIHNMHQVAISLTNQGVEPGDQVGIILPNSLEWYVIYWALIRIGAIPVPLNPQIGKWELCHLLRNLELKFCFSCLKYRSINHWQNFNEILEEFSNIKQIVFVSKDLILQSNSKFISYEDFLAQSKSGTILPYVPDPSETFMLACTSGSTGSPKIINVSQGGFYSSQWDMAQYLGLTSKDTMVLGMPLFHLGGFGMGVQTILAGGSVIYQSRFDAVDLLKIIQSRKVTALQLSSTLAKILLSVPNLKNYDISSLRLCYFAGEVLPNEIAKHFYRELGIRVVNIIGSTETATMLVWDSDVDSEYDCNSYRPLSFTEVKLCDEKDQCITDDRTGMIHISTKGLLKNYYKNPEETNAKIYVTNNKRWFRTGDLGKREESGRIHFIGRKKRALKRGANLIFPEDIESFLLTHPNVEAAAVTIEDHELLGEMIVAHIQSNPQKGITAGKLIKFCRGNLSSYKIPDEFTISTELPKDIGKIQYKNIRNKEDFS